MMKTKEQIMKDIMIYAKGKEITPSLIRRYLMEELNLSRSSAYRFFNKSDNEFIFLNKKTSEKRDNVSYSNEEYGKLTEDAFEILHAMKKNSSHTITLKEVIKIADEIGTTPRFLSCNILGLDTKAFDKLMRGEIQYSKLSLGLGFKDPILSEKVKQTKHILVQKKLGEKFNLEEINKLAEETQIPLLTMLKKVFCLTRAQILQLQKGKRVVFSNSREFIDYPYNESAEVEQISFEEISKDLELAQLSKSSYVVFQEEDKKDGIYEDMEFYTIESTSQTEFIEQLNNKKEKLSIIRQALIEKYDEMYLELQNSYKELNVKSIRGSVYTPNINKIMENYIRELKEIIIRNPKYYDFYPPKLKLEDFEKIAEDFNIDKSFLAYKMFGESHYERKKKNAENPYFEISTQKLPVASNFYMLFQTEIDAAINRIVNNTIRNNTSVSFSISEDLSQILRMRVLIRGNEILFYGKDCENKDEYLAGVFAYLKAVCDSQCKKLRSTNKSLNEKLTSDSDSELGDFISNTSETYLQSDDDIVASVIESATDSSDQQIIENMIKCLKETGNRESALEKLAKEIGISTEELETKLDEIYERLN